MTEDDIFWRRPDPFAERAVAPAHYLGPPVGEPADPQWHPSPQDPVTAPRPLPAVDHESIDLEERKAAKLTYAVGLAALAVLITVVCLRLF